MKSSMHVDPNASVQPSQHGSMDHGDGKDQCTDDDGTTANLSGRTIRDRLLLLFSMPMPTVPFQSVSQSPLTSRDHTSPSPWRVRNSGVLK
jgi:hypothetical protein